MNQRLARKRAKARMMRLRLVTGLRYKSIVRRRNFTVCGDSLDNLSAQKGDRIRRWAKKNRGELCFPYLRVLGQPDRSPLWAAAAFTIANSNHRNHIAQPRTCTPTCSGATATLATLRRRSPLRLTPVGATGSLSPPVTGHLAGSITGHHRLSRPRSIAEPGLNHRWRTTT
jgi:hypothetical protein